MVHWYKHDPDAFIAGTSALTLEEVGAYTLFIDLLYSRDAGVRADDDLLIIRTLRCDPRTWRRIKMSLMAKGKIWVTSDGKWMAKRVESTLAEIRDRNISRGSFAEDRSKSDRLPNQNNGPSRTTTTRLKESLLPFSLTTSEQLQPSSVLIAHETKTRSTPGARATAPRDGALARPASEKPIHELTVAEVMAQRHKKTFTNGSGTLQ